jgi:riboflavin synthase
MFTGIIKATGVIRSMEHRDGDMRVGVQSGGLPWQDFEPGESIAVNGVCLTAVTLHDDGFDTDVSSETLAVTALARLTSGSRVNLEPALSVGERLGGHLVSGHVDCVGTVRSRENDARSVRLMIEVPPEFRRYISRKGSVCVDGVSLTVNSVSDNSFDVNIIPHTAESTIIGEYRSGTTVNIEVDLLARYLERLVTERDDNGINKDFLRDHGYV